MTRYYSKKRIDIIHWNGSEWTETGFCWREIYADDAKPESVREWAWNAMIEDYNWLGQDAAELGDPSDWMAIVTEEATKEEVSRFLLG